jgi:hypothetical protein
MIAALMEEWLKVFNKRMIQQKRSADYPVAGCSDNHCDSNVNNLLRNDVYTESDLVLIRAV